MAPRVRPPPSIDSAPRTSLVAPRAATTLRTPVAAGIAAVLLAAGDGSLGPKQLDPVIRAKLLMALLGIVLLGLGLIVLIVIGARMVRRISRHEPRAKRPTQPNWEIEALLPGEFHPPDEDADDGE